MQRSVTIPFNSGSITITASYVDRTTENDFGYLLDDALMQGGKITFDWVIPMLNTCCRALEQNDTGTIVIANGSSMIEGVESIVGVCVQLFYSGVDSAQVNSLLKGTIVRDTLGYLVKMATTPEPHDCRDLADLLATFITASHSRKVFDQDSKPMDGGTFSFGADSPFAHQ